MQAVYVRERAVAALPGEKIELTYGNKLRVNVSAGYKGPATNLTLYGAIGVRGVTFDEKVWGEATWILPESRSSFTPTSASVEIPITSDIRPGTNYDIYCKILGHLDAGLPQVDNVIDIVGVPPTYKLVYSHTYPRAKTYRGKAEKCSTEIRIDLPEQLFPQNWMIDRIASAFEDEIKKQFQAASREGQERTRSLYQTDCRVREWPGQRWGYHPDRSRQDD